jgi:hypothetical protein
MGLARIAIAVLAVVLAVGLLILGGTSLWGALTGKDDKTPAASTPSASASGNASTKAAPPATQQSQSGNTIEVQCLVAPCDVFVSGPGPNDIQFNGTLGPKETRIFNGTRLMVAVQDSSGVAVTINGRPQARGRHGEAKTYEVPQ